MNPFRIAWANIWNFVGFDLWHIHGTKLSPFSITIIQTLTWLWYWCVISSLLSFHSHCNEKEEVSLSMDWNLKSLGLSTFLQRDYSCFKKWSYFVSILKCFHLFVYLYCTSYILENPSSNPPPPWLSSFGLVDFWTYYICVCYVYIYIYICVYVYVCMYVCMYVCIYLFKYPQ